jgi:hypothetical protein
MWRGRVSRDGQGDGDPVNADDTSSLMVIITAPV